MFIKESYQQWHTQRRQEYRIGRHWRHVAFLHGRLPWPQSVSTCTRTQQNTQCQTLTFDIFNFHPLAQSNFSGFLTLVFSLVVFMLIRENGKCNGRKLGIRVSEMKQIFSDTWISLILSMHVIVHINILHTMLNIHLHP